MTNNGVYAGIKAAKRSYVILLKSLRDKAILLRIDNSPHKAYHSGSFLYY